MQSKLVFGPVPSRRLGRSIGVNNIPPKICSYACIYCQLGKAIKMDVKRQTFFSPDEIVDAVKRQIEATGSTPENLDYLTFVPDGEATLDINLGKTIKALKQLPFKLAIITNSSLISRLDVQEELQMLDLVSLKVDAVTESVWRAVDHPHREINFKQMLDGTLQFASSYCGKLITETMLIDGVNDQSSELELTARHLQNMNPHSAYISIPTRSPAHKNVKPAKESKINEAFHIFSAHQLRNVEYLIGHEGNAFAHTGNTIEDILSITAVHPMREDSVREFLKHDDADWSLILDLLSKRLLLETSYEGNRFYVRRFSENQQV